MNILVISDLYTRFPFIDTMKTTTAKVIERLEHLISIFGYPNECTHDNEQWRRRPGAAG